MNTIKMLSILKYYRMFLKYVKIYKLKLILKYKEKFNFFKYSNFEYINKNTNIKISEKILAINFNESVINIDDLKNIPQLSIIEVKIKHYQVFDINAIINKYQYEHIVFIADLVYIQNEFFKALENILKINKDISLIYPNTNYIVKQKILKTCESKPKFNFLMLKHINYIGNIFYLNRCTILKLKNSKITFGPKPYALYDLLLQLHSIKNNEVEIINQCYIYLQQQYYSHTYLKNFFNKYINLINNNYDLNVCKNNVIIRYRKNNKKPLVSIIIPTKNNYKMLKNCINSIFKKTSYRNFEIILINNGSSEEKTKKYIQTISMQSKIKVYEYKNLFNYSRINNFAATKANGKYLIFLNDDTEVISRDWIQEMLIYAKEKHIGAVGAKLYYNDNTIQHAGIVLDFTKIAIHKYQFYPKSSSGNYYSLMVPQYYTAVTGACMMIKTSKFKKVSGFDEKLPVNYNDVDLCLKLNQIGYKNAWTPYSELYHFESKTRSKSYTIRGKIQLEKDKQIIKNKWKEIYKEENIDIY